MKQKHVVPIKKKKRDKKSYNFKKKKKKRRNWIKINNNRKLFCNFFFNIVIGTGIKPEDLSKPQIGIGSV